MGDIRDTEKRFFERQLVVFRIGKEEFGVDISDMREIIKIDNTTKIPDTENYIEGVINLRGKIVVIVDLAKKLGLSSSGRSKNTRVIVTEVMGNAIGFVIDSCNEVLRLTGDQIEGAPKIITDKINSVYIQGVGILKDRLIIIVDLGRVIDDKEIDKLGTNGKGKAKVLIIEDSTMMRGTLRSYIDQKRFNILEAADGEDGLNVFSRENPDIVLLDIKLPKMSGIEVLKVIKKVRPDTIVIMETSVYEDETKKECMTLGAREYLKKPINKKQIETLLANI